MNHVILPILVVMLAALPILTDVVPMLAGRDPSKLGYPNYWLQRKYDGTRVMVYKYGNVVRMIPRSFKNDYASRYPDIVAELRKFPVDFVMDTELTFFLNGTDIDDFVGALAVEARAGHYYKLMAFDLLEIMGTDITNKPIEERCKLLKELLSHRTFKYIAFVATHENKPGKCKEIIDNGGEGCVLKRKGSPYVPGSRSFWFKVKKKKTADCIIGGTLVGEGVRASTFGSLILVQYLQTEKGLVPICVGAASGFTNAEGASLHERIMRTPAVPQPACPWKGTRKVQKYISTRGKNALVAEIEYMERTRDNQLRHPVFIRLRDDKAAEDCIVEQGDESV